jgi:xanthine dehydrogenase YagT iron-sulfur-binding subunit
MTDESKSPGATPSREKGQAEEAKEPNFGSPRLTRRSFLSSIGAASLAATAVPISAVVVPTETQLETPLLPSGAIPVVLTINDKQHRLTLDPRVTLLDALRENLSMFGTKKGCDHGQCGACTVHVNGRRVNSCLTLAVMHQTDQITTIEGLAQGGTLHPMQAAFLEHDGFQCGYCTPGQIMSGAALMKEPVGTDDASVREFMSGNLCRCGAYNNIVAAVQQARRKA